MIAISQNVASQIIDSLAIVLDGKPSSAKPFSEVPYSGLSDYDWWGQDNNDAKTDTDRTKALFLAYLVLSGGRVPLVGIEIEGGWIRPDKWVAGALHKKGYWVVEGSEFVVTAKGWSLVADAVKSLAAKA